jgi:hypothetical protein
MLKQKELSEECNQKLLKFSPTPTNLLFIQIKPKNKKVKPDSFLSIKLLFHMKKDNNKEK